MIESIHSPHAPPPVLRMLRCKKTGRYFTGRGWTDDLKQAQEFPNDIQAVETCVQSGLKDVELVLRLAGAQKEFFTTALA